MKPIVFELCETGGGGVVPQTRLAGQDYLALTAPAEECLL